MLTKRHRYEQLETVEFMDKRVCFFFGIPITWQRFFSMLSPLAYMFVFLMPYFIFVLSKGRVTIEYLCYQVPGLNVPVNGTNASSLRG